MNPPIAMTRLIGTPRVAAVLYVGLALIVLGWMGGAVPWWVGIVALCGVGTVRKAVQDVKRYDAWASQWRAMGGAPAAAKPTNRPSSRGMLTAQSVAFAFMAWIIWNMTPPGQRTPDGQALMWFLMMGGFFWSTWRLIASSRRRRGKAKARPTSRTKETTREADVVEWILPPASASPSRSDATRKLPEYAARLIAPGG
jgi:hypothetical protein